MTKDTKAKKAVRETVFWLSVYAIVYAIAFCIAAGFGPWRNEPFGTHIGSIMLLALPVSVGVGAVLWIAVWAWDTGD